MSYESTLELRNLLQEEVNDTTPESTTAARYLALLNMAHKAVIAGGRELNLDDSGNPIRRPIIFPWALSPTPKIFTLLPFQSGSADVTQYSTSVLNSTIASGTTNLTGWHIRFNQQATVYKIITHSGTTITLDGEYVDDAGTATAFDVFKLVYDIGSDDILMPTDKIRIYSKPNIAALIAITGSNEMFDQHPLHRINMKVPESAAVLTQVGGTLTLQFSSYPDHPIRGELRYVPIPADLDLLGSNPIIPAGSENRLVLVHLAAYYHLRKRDDDRANVHLAHARKIFDAMTTEANQIMNSNDPDYGKVAPWAGGFDGFDANGSIIIEI